MNLNHLRIFRSVADAQSYSRAADRLYLSQPYVYVQMRRFEKELGCRLLEQSGKRVVLTEAGQVLMTYADQMLRLESEAIQTLHRWRGGEHGQLTVSAGRIVGNYILPPLIVAFKRRYPQVQLNCVTMKPAEIVEPLLRFQIDLAINGSRLALPNVLVDPVWQSRSVLCVGRNHPLANCPKVGAADLAREVFVWFGDAPVYREVAEKALATLGASSRPTLVVDDVEAVKRVVMRDYGVAMLPQPSIVDEQKSGNLVVLQVPSLDLPQGIYCHRHPERPLTSATAAFLEVARESAARPPWQD